MNGDRVIDCVDLIEILEANGAVPDCQVIVDRLRARGMGELVLKAIPADELKAIYERRRMRMPDAHPLTASVDRLLTGLKRYPGIDVLAITVESSSRIAAVWLDGSGVSVIATLVDSRTD